MKVFKFGGASIKDAEAIKNVSKIISERNKQPLLVVVSALGKTTNALEDILNRKTESRAYDDQIVNLEKTHRNILNELFNIDHPIHNELTHLLDLLKANLKFNLPYNEHYDQTISIGELMSSTIISNYIDTQGTNSHWLDARKYIRTNDHFREGIVDWEWTAKSINNDLPDILKDQVVVTQGFIGGTKSNQTTTLGREGSDFSGAIFAYCLDAKSITVWKDVPGILNADPKLDPKAKMFSEIPYQEAAEMTFYGASVIHPKTIKPLANKNIPLRVRSFISPENPGTTIHECSVDNIMPTFIVKPDQCLISFKVIDFSFINEENLSLIFQKLSEADLKINIMQNSAISFSIAIDYNAKKLDHLMTALKSHFDIKYNTGLQLITIKNYTAPIIEKYQRHQGILLEQISRNNYRALMK